MCSLTFSEFRASCVGRCAWWNRGRAWSLPVSRCETVSGDWGMGREAAASVLYEECVRGSELRQGVLFRSVYTHLTHPEI